MAPDTSLDDRLGDLEQIAKRRPLPQKSAEQDFRASLDKAGGGLIGGP